MAEIGSATYIPAPAVATPTQGALYILPVHDVAEGARELYSGVVYEGDGCLPEVGTVTSDPDDCIRSAVKEFEEGLDFVQSFSFTGYKALKCRPGALGGGDNAEYLARVERQYTRGESYFIEQGLSGWFQANGTQLGPTVDSTLTPEEAAAILFDSVSSLNAPIIHAPRAAGLLLSKDSVVEKAGGTLVVGAGYGTLAAGRELVFGTGPVNIWRGGIVTHLVNDVANNQTMAIAERQYTVTVECDIHYVDTQVFVSGVL